MDELTQFFMEKYGMDRGRAREQAMFYLRQPDNPMTQHFIDQSRSYFDAKAQNQPVQTDAANGEVHTIHGKLPKAPLPLNPAALTPAHIEDANIAAWQDYAGMLDYVKSIYGEQVGENLKKISKAPPRVARDAAMGEPLGNYIPTKKGL